MSEPRVETGSDLKKCKSFLSGPSCGGGISGETTGSVSLEGTKRGSSGGSGGGSGHRNASIKRRRIVKGRRHDIRHQLMTTEGQGVVVVGASGVGREEVCREGPGCSHEVAEIPHGCIVKMLLMLLLMTVMMMMMILHFHEIWRVKLKRKVKERGGGGGRESGRVGSCRGGKSSNMKGRKMVPWEGMSPSSVGDRECETSPFLSLSHGLPLPSVSLFCTYTHLGLPRSTRLS